MYSSSCNFIKVIDVDNGGVVNFEYSYQIVADDVLRHESGLVNTETKV